MSILNTILPEFILLKILCNANLSVHADLNKRKKALGLKNEK